MNKIEDGQKEARTNKKFLTEIEDDLKKYILNLDQDSLKRILSCLQKIYSKSNFYKEG